MLRRPEARDRGQAGVGPAQLWRPVRRVGDGERRVSAALSMEAAPAVAAFARDYRAYLYAGITSLLAIPPKEKWPGVYVGGRWLPARDWQLQATAPVDEGRLAERAT